MPIPPGCSLVFSIQLKQVGKQFGEFSALRDISQTIVQGDRIAIVGHNGAGKSTLLNLVATLSRPTSGEITYALDGQPLENTARVRALLTYFSHDAMMYPDLTGLENLKFAARMYGKPEDDASLRGLLQKVGMARAGERVFRTCSRGMQQRLSLARALLPEPLFLLLDEPFSGLDEEGVARLKTVFCQAEWSWLMVVHDIGLGYELADRFWILKRGKLEHNLSKSEVGYEDYLALARGTTMEGVGT